MLVYTKCQSSHKQCSNGIGVCTDVCLCFQNARKGEFSRASVKGKRACELGAGPGLGGMAFALLGAEVLLTDLPDIVPLIRKNVDANFTSAALHGAVLPATSSCLSLFPNRYTHICSA